MSAPLYNLDILRLAASIAPDGRLATPDATVERRSAVCGSRVAVDVIADEQGRVAQFGQEVSACALGQAAAALLARNIVGSDAGQLAAARDALTDWLGGARDDPGGWPGLHLLASARAYPARHPSIRLAFEAAAEAARLAAGARP